MASRNDDLTRLIRQWDRGAPEALGELVTQLSQDLRQIARSLLARERRDHTLQPTALVSEAYLRLVEQHRARFKDRSHFLAFVATLMRRILVDHARSKKSLKRGGHEIRVTLSVAQSYAKPEIEVDILALEDCLSRLQKRMQQVVELRYFGGLKLQEIADVLGVGSSTVSNDWTAAKVLLKRCLAEGTQP